MNKLAFEILNVCDCPLDKQPSYFLGKPSEHLPIYWGCCEQRCHTVINLGVRTRSDFAQYIVDCLNNQSEIMPILRKIKYE